MVFTDIMEHLQWLNIELQGKHKIIADLSQKIFSFQKICSYLNRICLQKLQQNSAAKMQSHAIIGSISKK